jgi:hypothetical protein
MKRMSLLNRPSAHRLKWLASDSGWITGDSEICDCGQPAMSKLDLSELWTNFCAGDNRSGYKGSTQYSLSLR